MRASSKLSWELRTGIALALGVSIVIFGGITIASEFSYVNLLGLLVGIFVMFIAVRWAKNIKHYSKSYPIG